MIRRQLFVSFLAVLVIALTFTIVSAQGPKPLPPKPKAPTTNAGTAFTYQAQLKNSGSLINGSCDFRFGLWDDANLGNQIGVTQSIVSTLTNGLFTTPIDFGGSNVFTGDGRWLAIRLRCPAGSGTLVDLSPRQALTPAPIALSLPGLSTQSGPGAQLTTPTASYGFVQTDGTINLGTYVGYGAGWVGTNSNHPLQFFTNNSSAQVTLLQNGNFGIGTITPGEQLEVDGVDTITRIRNTNDTGGAFLGNTHDSLQMGLYNSTGSTWGVIPAHTKKSFLGITNNGNVCTASQTFPNALSCRNTLDDGSGNVGIGTATPSSQLEVDGSTSTIRMFDTNDVGYGGAFIGANYNKLTFGLYNPTGSTWGGIPANQSDTFMTIDNNGAICSISFTTCRNQLDDGVGNGYFWGTLTVHNLGAPGTTSLCQSATWVIATCSSSLRYKNNIVNLTMGLNTIAQLRPVTYDWKSNGEHDLGLVAEEVNAVAPILTTANKDGQVEGVKYDKLTSVLVKGIQEQQQQIASLQAQNAALEHENNNLETRVTAIEQTMKAYNTSPQSNADATSAHWLLLGGLVAVGLVFTRRGI